MRWLVALLLVFVLLAVSCSSEKADTNVTGSKVMNGTNNVKASQEKNPKVSCTADLQNILTAHKNCTIAKPFCDPDGEVCVECLDDTQCVSGSCESDYTCSGSSLNSNNKKIFENKDTTGTVVGDPCLIKSKRCDSKQLLVEYMQDICLGKEIEPIETICDEGFLCLDDECIEIPKEERKVDLVVDEIGSSTIENSTLHIAHLFIRNKGTITILAPFTVEVMVRNNAGKKVSSGVFKIQDYGELKPDMIYDMASQVEGLEVAKDEIKQGAKISLMVTVDSLQEFAELDEQNNKVMDTTYVTACSGQYC